MGVELSQIFDVHDDKLPVGLTFDEFLTLFSEGKIDLQLSKIELLNLFNNIDINKNGIISNVEFLEWFNKFTKPSEKELREREQRLHVLNEVTNLLSNYHNEFQNSNKMSQGAETSYRKFIDGLTLDENDYHRGRKTILKDPFKALKVAQKKADKIILKREEAKKKKQENYNQIFYVDEEFCITTNTESAEQSSDVPQTKMPADYQGKYCLMFKDMPAKYICSDERHWQNVQWLRPYEIVHKRGVTDSTSNDKPEDLLPTFFAQKVETKDVNQGLLGDCWLLAALSIVAQRTEYLRGNVGKTAEQLDKELTDAEVAAVHQD